MSNSLKGMCALGQAGLSAQAGGEAGSPYHTLI